ncbi:hypothetical protein JG687_00013592, partial [Phytophthora cactorum]
EKSALQTDLSASSDVCYDLAGQVGRFTTDNAGLRTERNQARDRLGQIATLLPSSVPTGQPLPSGSSPARKRARSPVASLSVFLSNGRDLWLRRRGLLHQPRIRLLLRPFARSTSSRQQPPPGQLSLSQRITQDRLLTVVCDRDPCRSL